MNNLLLCELDVVWSDRIFIKSYNFVSNDLTELHSHKKGTNGVVPTLLYLLGTDMYTLVTNMYI